MRFLICASCARHVKDGDGACPFCGAITSDAKYAGNSGKFARNRLGVLFGATTSLVAGAAVISACSDGTNTGGAPAIFYGGAIIEDAGAATDTGAPATFYGAAIPDAGPQDAGHD